jgi:hypothetical protein
VICPLDRGRIVRPRHGRPLSEQFERADGVSERDAVIAAFLRKAMWAAVQRCRLADPTGIARPFCGGARATKLPRSNSDLPVAAGSALA